MKMYLLFSHTLTEFQIQDAKTTLKIDEFIYLPKNLQKIWSEIPPEIDNLSEYLSDIKEFLKKTKKGEYVLIQGEFGAVYHMVNFSKSLGLIPIYATTKRETIELKVNDKIIKKSVFRHIRFREYL